MSRRSVAPISALIVLVLLSGAAAQSVEAAGTGEAGRYTITTVTNEALGTYLVDSAGRTLYYSTDDLPGLSNCAGGCAAIWPPVDGSVVRVPSTLDPAAFGFITRDNGRRQLTYKGWPLYHYSRDWAPHDTNGQGLYGAWYVVQPALFGPSKS